MKVPTINHDFYLNHPALSENFHSILPVPRVADGIFVQQVFEWLVDYMDGSRQVSSLETKDGWDETQNSDGWWLAPVILDDCFLMVNWCLFDGFWFVCCISGKETWEEWHMILRHTPKTWEFRKYGSCPVQVWLVDCNHSIIQMSLTWSRDTTIKQIARHKTAHKLWCKWHDQKRGGGLGQDVVSILISADFLQMKALVEECVETMFISLPNILALPLDLGGRSKLLESVWTLNW